MKFRISRRRQISILLTAIAAIVLAAWSPISTTASLLPLTGSGDSQSEAQTISNRIEAESRLPSLTQFAADVSDGRGQAVRGVYVPDTLALQVLQQPAANPGFVTSTPDAVSQFGMAAAYDTIGLLAHNYLAGQQFFALQPGQVVIVVRADGSRDRYRIDAVHSYQALSPASPMSDFLELKEDGRRLSAQHVFDMMYGTPDQLVFQTCIERDGNSYWGRLFVVATPVEFGVGVNMPIKLDRMQATGFFRGL